MIPKNTTDPSYSFELDLNQRHRLWSAKRACLGFSPEGRMLYMGKYNQEQIFLAMVPRSFTHEDDDDPNEDRIEDEDANMVRLDAKTSAMTEAHYCMVVAFLARQLQRNRYKDTVLREDYPHTLTVEYLRRQTELLYVFLILRIPALGACAYHRACSLHQHLLIVSFHTGEIISERKWSTN